MSRVGCLGAATGAVTGGFKGGLGQASVVLAGGWTVAALVVCNAVGSAVDPVTGELLAGRALLPGDGRLPGPLSSAERAAVGTVAGRAASPRAAWLPASASSEADPAGPDLAAPLRATCLGVVATDVSLTKAQCARLAGIAHDGLARAINPVHTLYDGDTIFGVSTERTPAPSPADFQEILVSAAEVMTRAVVRAMLAATGVETSAGSWPAYGEVVGQPRS